MTLSKEVKTGMIVVVGIVLLVWGLNFLKGKDFFTSDKVLFAVYEQVEGLSPSNPVMLNGMKIGQIRDMNLLGDTSGQIIVSMHVTDKVKIPKNSTAEIFSVDILGSKGIRIVLGNEPGEIEDGDTLSSGLQKSLSEEVNAQVAPLKAKAESLLSSMDSVLLVIREVFNDRTKNNLKRSFESISHSLTSIEHITGNLDTVLAGEGRLKKIFENLESISSNLKDNNEKITTIINNFSAISDTIARSNFSQTLENTRKTLEQTAGVMEKVNKGEGTLGQLVHNDSLYNNLNLTAQDLDLLLKDLRENPGKFVKVSLISFGK
jgi:phospholipid/cholesterol/gamma-HCH transport system substrate-binding protein